MTSFDVKGGHHLPDIEIYGTEGSLAIPSPNGFGGELRMRRSGDWETVEHTHGHSNGCRGIGAAEVAAAVQAGRPARVSGELAYHVLDIGLSLCESADSGKTVDVASTVERPALMPEGLAEDMGE